MNVVQTALSSARFNRLLFWLSAAVLAVGVLVVVTRIYGSDKTTLSPDPGFIPKLPVKSTPLTNTHGATIKSFSDLDPQVVSAVRTFIATAVARRHLDQSWAVISPSMRAGYTFNRWKNASALPVIPYPGVVVDATNYYLDYASTKEIMLEVGLSTRPGSGIRPVAFQLALTPAGKGLHKRWLVNYWMPRWTAPLPVN